MVKIKPLPLSQTHSELCKEWDYEKNYPITPKDITYGSAIKRHWICKNNHKYPATPGARTNSLTGCPHCPYKNQNIIYDYLINNKYNFIDEYCIPKLLEDQKRDSKIDFYLPDYNLFIEYDGRQHFQPVKNFSRGLIKEADKNFQRQQFRDKALVKYCKDGNINLLRIDGRKYQNKHLEIYLQNDLHWYLNSLIFSFQPSILKISDIDKNELVF
jgi:hypothetical protein